MTGGTGASSSAGFMAHCLSRGKPAKHIEARVSPFVADTGFSQSNVSIIAKASSTSLPHHLKPDEKRKPELEVAAEFFGEWMRGGKRRRMNGTMEVRKTKEAWEKEGRTDGADLRDGEMIGSDLVGEGLRGRGRKGSRLVMHPSITKSGPFI